MELRAPLRVVVGRHGLDLDVRGILDAVAVLQGYAVTEHIVDRRIRIDAGGRCAYTGDGLTVEVVLVLVGDEDDVGLGELVVVRRGLYTEAHRVYLYLRPVVVDSDTGVLDARECHFLAALGGELVHLLCSVTADCRQAAQQNGKNTFLHINVQCSMFNVPSFQR